MIHCKQESQKGSVSWRAVVLVGLGLAVVAVLTVAIHQHFQKLEQQLAVLEAGLQETLAKAGQSAEEARAALALATEAEQNAQQAALGRARAEQDSAAADDQAVRARQDADRASEEARLARAEVERLREQREMELERMRSALSQIAETERTALGLVMSLGSDSIRFDFDKAALRPEDRELLSRIAGVLLASYGFRVHVYGHTDDIGTEEYNQDLWERRAQAVRDYFVAAGIEQEIISVRGYGKSSPRVPGTTQEARSRNRRVEIGIVDTVIAYQGEASNRGRQP